MSTLTWRGYTCRESDSPLEILMGSSQMIVAITLVKFILDIKAHELHASWAKVVLTSTISCWLISLIFFRRSFLDNCSFKRVATIVRDWLSPHRLLRFHLRIHSPAKIACSDSGTVCAACSSYQEYSLSWLWSMLDDWVCWASVAPNHRSLYHYRRNVVWSRFFVIILASARYST